MDLVRWAFGFVVLGLLVVAQLAAQQHDTEPKCGQRENTKFSLPHSEAIFTDPIQAVQFALDEQHVDLDVGQPLPDHPNEYTLTKDGNVWGRATVGKYPGGYATDEMERCLG